MPSLQKRLDEFKKSFESGTPLYNTPRETIETMHRATAELNATGIEDPRRPRSKFHAVAPRQFRRRFL